MSRQASDQTKAKGVFRDVVAMLERGGFDYAVGGGLATDYWRGDTKRIGDIDLVIREDDASAILKSLSSANYKTAEMEDSWLHKAFKDGVTVDLMFELKNGTRFDERFKKHRKEGELFGSVVFVISPEDLVASLVGTIDRETVGQHWYSIIDIMASNDLEWDYLIRRAQQIPHKMLSVIYFAISENVPVQKGVIEQLQELTT